MSAHSTATARSRARRGAPALRRGPPAPHPTRAPKATDRLSVTLASGAFARLIGYFSVRPDATPHLRALMRDTDLSARSVQLELSRLEQLGLVERTPGDDGRVRIRAISRGAAWVPFRALVRTYGDPADLLRLALADVAGIAAAFVFGSVAQGTEGPESDIDLFVVAGVAERTEVRELEQLVARRTVEASLAIGREVNVVVRTGGQLNDKLAARHGFHERILAGPKLWVLGDGRAVAAARRGAVTLAAGAS